VICQSPFGGVNPQKPRFFYAGASPHPSQPPIPKGAFFLFFLARDSLGSYGEFPPCSRLGIRSLTLEPSFEALGNAKFFSYWVRYSPARSIGHCPSTVTCVSFLRVAPEDSLLNLPVVLSKPAFRPLRCPLSFSEGLPFLGKNIAFSFWPSP